MKQRDGRHKIIRQEVTIGKSNKVQRMIMCIKTLNRVYRKT